MSLDYSLIRADYCVMRLRVIKTEKVNGTYLMLSTLSEPVDVSGTGDPCEPYQTFLVRALILQMIMPCAKTAVWLCETRGFAPLNFHFNEGA